MNFKEIIYPNKLNSIIFVILFIILTPFYQIVNFPRCSGFLCRRYGFPFAFLVTQACKAVGGPFDCLKFSNLAALYLILDIIILYCLALLIGFVYSKIKSK